MTPTTPTSCQVMAAASTIPSLMSATSSHRLSRDGSSGVYRKRKYIRQKRRSGANVCNGLVSILNSDDNDVFSDDEEDEMNSKKSLSGSPSELVDDDRRAHHNELERRRRDHIKDHFMALKNSIPLLEGEKSSRALILKRAVEYISLMQAQLKDYKLEMERQNEMLALAKHHAGAAYNKTTSIQQQLPSSFSPPQQPAGLVNSNFLNGSIQSTSPSSSSSAFVGALPFSPTTPSILSTSTTTNITNNSPSLLPLTSNPSAVNHASSTLSDSLQLATANEPIGANNTHNLTSFLSSLLIQNHPLLSQLQFQQQQQQKQLASNSVMNSSPVLSAFGAAPAGIGSYCTTASETHMLNSSLLAETQRTRLLASTLALRERQLAASVGTNSSVI